jgi:hypothetical protein
MSCECIAHVEIKYEGHWFAFDKPKVFQNYELFAKMAGVRGEAKPIVEPRGIPTDVSVVARIHYGAWNPDAHTPSWLTRDEVWQVIEWFRDTEIPKWGFESNRMTTSAAWFSFGFLFGDGWQTPIIPARYAGVTDVRLVFWFVGVTAIEWLKQQR